MRLKEHLTQEYFFNKIVFFKFAHAFYIREKEWLNMCKIPKINNINHLLVHLCYYCE